MSLTHAYRHKDGWNHEEMSRKMFEYLIDDNQLDYSREDVRFISDLIAGDRSGYIFPVISFHY